MIQRVLKLQMLVIGVLCSISSWAESTTYVKSYYADDNVTLKYSISYTFDPEDGTNEAYVSASTINSVSDIEILSTFEYEGVTYTVTKIGSYVFRWKKNLGNVVLPNTITVIGEGAFYGAQIESITIPNSVTTLEGTCFCQVTMESINIPNSITTWGDYVFQESTFSSVTFEEGLKTIGYCAFRYCQNLKSITIPSSVETLEPNAFSSCSNLKEIHLNEGLKSLNGNGYWQEGAFSYDTSLETVVLPNSLTWLGVGTFRECTSLKSITLSKRLENIQAMCFYGCKSLTEIDIPSSVTLIYGSVFTNAGLKHIYIPSSVQSFSGTEQFKNCPLESIEVDEDNKWFDSRDNCNAIIETSTNKLIYGCKNTIIPETVNLIGERAFENVEGLKSVNLSSIGGGIQAYAFDNCKDLTDVIVTGENFAISNFAFYNCTNLKNVNLPSVMINIGGNAFSGCTSLEKIVMPETLSSLGDYAFYNCTSLTSMSIPTGVKSIPDHAFYNCPISTSLTIPSDVTYIGEQSFYYWEKLNDIYCYAVEPPTINVNSFYVVDTDNCVVHVPAGSIEKYQAADYWKKFKNFVQFTYPVTSIELDKSHVKLPIYGTETLTATVYPINADDPSLTWSSSNPDAVSVDQEGNITINSSEPAIISATANDGSGKVANCYVNYTLQLIDGEEFTNESETEWDDISYTRTFNNTDWQALYIPFSMSYDDWSQKYDIAYIDNFVSFDTDDDGVIDQVKMYYVKVKSGSIYPNHPYIIKSLNTGEQTISLSQNNTAVSKAESKSIECASTSVKYTITGTYSPIDGSTLYANNCYALGGGALGRVSSTSTLKPYRWYLSTESLGSEVKIAENVEVKLVEVGAEETTGVDNVQNEVFSQVYYSANGAKLSVPQKGLNIVKMSDGSIKKVFSK